MSNATDGAKPLCAMSDEEAMAAALPYLRRLSHCEPMLRGNRQAAACLADSIEMVAAAPLLRAVPTGDSEEVAV